MHRGLVVNVVEATVPLHRLQAWKDTKFIIPEKYFIKNLKLQCFLYVLNNMVDRVSINDKLCKCEKTTDGRKQESQMVTPTHLDEVEEFGK